MIETKTDLTPSLDSRPPLAPEELCALRACEETIRRGLGAFVAMGNALARIRDAKLYREEFSTFEDYCLARWEMTSRRARQLWAAAEVVGKLSTRHFSVLPLTESQARPLTALPAEEQADAWEEIVQTAPTGGITTSHVAMVAQKRMKSEGRMQKVEARSQMTEAGSKEERVRAKAASALAELRGLQDEIGTADGAVSAGVAMAISHVDLLREHLSRVATLQANRQPEEIKS